MAFLRLSRLKKYAGMHYLEKEMRTKSRHMIHACTASPIILDFSNRNKTALVAECILCI